MSATETVTVRLTPDEVWPFTRHGHLVSGVPTTGREAPQAIARCGGPPLCTKCALDAEAIRAQYKRRGCRMSALLRCPECGCTRFIVASHGYVLCGECGWTSDDLHDLMPETMSDE